MIALASKHRAKRARLVRVYMAGPIGKNDWRHRLVPELGTAFSGDAEERGRARFDVTTELPTITPGIVCVGPWFSACDHGCFHGPGTHGAIGQCCDAGVDEDRSDVFYANIARIRRADAMFAYIDRKEAYGSLVEIGEALDRKPFFLGYPPDAPWRDDMWFAEQAALGSYADRTGSVEGLWAKFCQYIGSDLQTGNDSRSTGRH